VYIC